MTEFTFKCIDESGDIAIVNAETIIEALQMIESFYKYCNFQLIASTCLDCQ